MAKPKPTRKTSAEAPGDRLARLRRARGLSQRQLAKLSGISNRMIAYYETKADSLPAHVLGAFAKVLQVSSDQLLGLKESDTPAFALDTRILRRLQLIEHLPPADRRYIVKQIELLARQAGVDIDSAA